ncbi:MULTISPECIES: S-layer homology domain-containing protein [Acidaminococcus]|uniref:S-layer domain protein n=1 Tax=Acidaminococcus fermentans (strain ATCC 25085 / DSM 20731 / CCUG 9996 / CIP 106432 / VR4) TaxID=591001 RepID=D2RLS3_ACIFV|nr:MULTISPECIES: S-layer homology domain-containing protein [Acidaminococcus]ADB48025.1 S-layer domain protein [Acidaminococcus fermentans DSM 20731]MCI6286868.1 S-layer homology domain-containing protein [Acidaminococcus fermentans]UEA71361.1 S-layer homology domain-containing protein [Acidaminococcus fermentans DSM 20731]CDE94152.1 s-layer domain protein [Acidaminococcus sp. CAG:542]
MKKSLVFAMAMALGVSATAFAANPFSDLPAGHWAYGAVAKLAAAGVVDGYPDGTFKGDKTMTRYEMAQIVAKALAKGAIGADDKLVSEFADELDNLGVRVAKLEKNADAVKITGNIRTHYAHTTGDFGKKSVTKTRSRLFFTGEVNDNWHYVGMLQNEQQWNNKGDNDSGDNDTDFQRAYLTGNIGVVNMNLGRYNGTYAEGNVYDTRVDAVNANTKFGATYLGATWGKMANVDTYGWTGFDKATADEKAKAKESKAGEFTQAVLGGDIGNLNLEANYLHVKDLDTNWVKGSDNIWTAAANYKAGDWKIGAMYLHGDADEKIDGVEPDNDGWVATLAYKGASAAKAGSWGLFGKYYDQGGATYIAHTMNGNYDAFGPDGFKGWMVGGNLTVAKNMVAQVEYYDLKDKGSTSDHNKTLWSQMVVTF